MECLKEVMEIAPLKNYYLVGGTALALQIGHRISIDLDLFSRNDFDPNDLFQKIRDALNHRTIEFTRSGENTLNLQIDNIKVDILKFDYPLLEPIHTIDNIRLMSIPYIIATKLSAISNRGAKKDFIDMYFILQEYSLNEVFDFFQKKFNIKIGLHQIKSLVYFYDADRQPDAVMLNNISWEIVKNKIISKIDEHLNKTNN